MSDPQKLSTLNVLGYMVSVQAAEITPTTRSMHGHYRQYPTTLTIVSQQVPMGALP